MQANKTVTINGRTYDAVTGLPVDTKSKTATSVKKPAAAKAAAAQRAGHVAASSVHAAPQRSQTLHRRSAKKSSLTKRPKPGQHMDISRSAKVSRFAPNPLTSSKKDTSAPDTAARNHPLADRANAKVTTKSQPVSSKQVKDAAISAALAKPSPKEDKPRRFRWSRRFTVITAVFVVLILGAALTYFNLPSLSVGFAASQAGIDARYPEYRPDGYRLEQPVTFKDGEVTLKFASNSGQGGYTITQTRSSWDSTAVLDNVVRKAVGDDYVTTQERGLTIYSYNSNSAATWVNGGILYKIVSSAPLSGEQIRHIATSL